MANNVTAVQLGGQPQVMSGVSTAKDIMDKLGLSNVSVKVNGNSADPNTTLKDYDFVAFGEKVKGGIVAVVVVCNK